MGIKKKKKLQKQNKSRQNSHIQNTGLEFLTKPVSDLQGDITEDIVYFFRSFPDSMRSPQIATEAMVRAVLHTEKIATEPEFHDIVGDPIHCVLIFSETISKADVNWHSFGDLPPKLAEFIRLQVMEETIRNFLTESLRSEILEGLNRYLIRKKQSGDRKEASIAAVIHIILKDEGNNLIWPKIGLLHGIIHNSISFGLEIKDSYNQILGIDKKDSPEKKDLLHLDDQTRTEILKKASLKMAENPKFKNFINRQTKRIYEEGIAAIMEGKLYLGFLSVEDLNKISERIVSITGFSLKDCLNDANAFLSGLTEKKQKKLMADIEIFIDETFTHQKIELILEKLNSILKDPGDMKPWVPFIIMIRDSLTRDNKLESRNNILKCITFGELSAFQGYSQNS